MAHALQPQTPYSIVTVKLALQTTCGDTAADGLNVFLSEQVATGFVADYALLHTDSPIVVESSQEPEEGELFTQSGTWLVMPTRDGVVTGYHRVDSALALNLMSQDELFSKLSGKFEIEPGEYIEVIKIEDLRRHVV